MGYFKEIFYGGLSLIEGMVVTGRRLFHPLVTVQYPRKKIPLSAAYRGHIELKIFEDTGTHKCIVCLNCEKTCPSGVIRVQGVKMKEKGPRRQRSTLSISANVLFAAFASKSVPPRLCNIPGSLRWSARHGPIA